MGTPHRPAEAARPRRGRLRQAEEGRGSQAYRELRQAEARQRTEGSSMGQIDIGFVTCMLVSTRRLGGVTGGLLAQVSEH